ncbi:transposase [Rhodovibrio salinarum]|uniref:Transposase DDE domain-containing protein n=1 Tax=Rhodovibrio salinarum TaxID=1087 RepID=A0A934QGZ5_9PROT|nr:transposase [Rhodovibrio salinarum]MBK1696618.1 hypothetical protein [Rhodovibrio salinarum]
MDRFAVCFTDGRMAGRVVHDVRTLVGQPVFGIALGYEDLNDHNDFRRDPVLGPMLGRLEARRTRLCLRPSEWCQSSRRPRARSAK